VIPIKGLIVAPPNPFRRRLRIRIEGPVASRAFLSGNEFVTNQDLSMSVGEDELERIAFDGPIYAAGSVAGVTIHVEEET